MSYGRISLEPVLIPQRLDSFDRGLVGEWRFDCNSGLLLPDYSGYGSHGTVDGAVWDATPLGASLLFDGSNDFVTCPHRDVQRCLDTDQPGEITVEVLYRWTTLQAGWRTVVSKPGPSGGDWGWRLAHDNSNPPHVEFSPGASKYRRSAQTLAVGALYHAICTADRASNVYHVYVNGVLDDGATSTGGSWPESTTLDISIGRRGGDNDRYFPGDILLVRIYNRVLPADEVRRQYEKVTARASGLVSLWALPLLVAEAGQEFQQSANGSVAPAGVIVRQIGSLGEGAVAPSGTIVRQIGSLVEGAVAPTGTIVKQIATSLVGSISPSGVATGVRTFLQSVAGTIAPAGAIVRQTGKILAGSIAPAAAIVRQIAASLSGIIAPSGVATGLDEYWVALDGDDENPGTEEEPWLTPAYANTQVSQGDIVHFEDGTYVVSSLTGWPSGVSGSPIIFAAVNSGSVTFQISSDDRVIDMDTVSYFSFNGIAFQGDDEGVATVVQLLDCDHITLNECEVYDSGGRGIWVRGTCSDIALTGCEVHNEVYGEALDGIQVDDCTNLEISECVVYHTPHDGIKLDGAIDTADIYNNTIYGTGSHGISVGESTMTDVDIHDNDIYDAGLWPDTNPRNKHGIRIHDQGSCNIYRNTIHQCAGPGIGIVPDAAGANIYHNVIYDCLQTVSTPDDYGDFFLGGSGETGHPNIDFRNNIIYHTRASAYSANLGADYDNNLSMDYNLWFDSTSYERLRRDGTTYTSYSAYQTAGFEPNSVMSDDPEFRDASGDDFRLMPDSPAIDEGVYIAGYNDDYEGDAPDIGAYEYTTIEALVSGVLDMLGSMNLQAQAALSGASAPAGALIRQGQKTLSGALAPVGVLIGQGQKALSGALAPVGALVQQISTLLAGSIGPGGTLIKQALLSLSGVVSQAGALVRQVSTSPAGSIGLAGDLIRQMQTSLVGTIAPAGALVRQARAVLAGSAAPAGALIRQTATSLAGSISPSGAVAGIKTVLYSVAGSIALAGALVGQAQKSFVGEIVPVGALIRQTATSLAGSVSPSGIADGIRTILRSVVGAIAPSGTLVRQTGKVLAGSIGPVGSWIGQAFKSISGSIAPAGVIVRQVGTSLAGNVAPVGVLVRQVAASLAGSIAPAGTLIKQISALLAGSVSPSGIADGIRTILQSISGAIAPASALAGQVQKVLLGALMPSGDLIGQARKILSGVIGPAGMFISQAQKMLSGSVSPSGALFRRTLTVLAGALSPAGALASVVTSAIAVIKTLTLRGRSLTLETKERALSITARGRSFVLGTKERADE